MTTQDSDHNLRERALKRLKKKREFSSHLVVYLGVNALLIVIWAISGAGFFWPVFPIVGWGIGILAHARDVYQGEPTEQDIQKEIDHLSRR